MLAAVLVGSGSPVQSQEDLLGNVINASFQLPTVIFTVLLILALALWLLSLVGFGNLDDGLEGLDGATDGPLGAVGLADVPIQIVFTIFALVGWAVSVLTQLFILDSVDGTTFALVALLAAVGAGVVGFGVVAVSAPWLSRTFAPTTAFTADDLVGATVEVRSGSVTQHRGYGDVRTPDGTTSRVEIRTRTDIGSSTFSAGDVALVVDYDSPSNTYTIDHLPSDLL
ncbi:MAG TPA: hypothetical protein VMM60_17305 [Ilumatobacter sp.]|nr:hypothetical protein [Ilumatobacter sp.]